MSARVDYLIEEVLSCASDEESALNLAIQDCLDGKEQIEVAKSWANEIRVRKAALRSGTTQAIPWTEARARLSVL